MLGVAPTPSDDTSAARSTAQRILHTHLRGGVEGVRFTSSRHGTGRADLPQPSESLPHRNRSPIAALSTPPASDNRAAPAS